MLKKLFPDVDTIDNNLENTIADFWNSLQAGDIAKTEFLSQILQKYNYQSAIIINSAENAFSQLKNTYIIEQPKSLEEFRPVSQLRSGDPAYNQYLVLIQLFALSILDNAEFNQPCLLLTKRIDDDQIELQYFYQTNRNFVSLSIGLCGYVFATKFLRLPGTKAFGLRIQASLQEIKNKFPDNLSITPEEFICSSNGGSYAKLAIIQKDNKYLVHKEAWDKGYAKLADEITWLVNLPKEIKELFPEVIDYKILETEKRAWLRLEYLPWPSLKKILFWEPFICGDESIKRGTKELIDPEAPAVVFDYLLNIYKRLIKILYTKYSFKTPKDFFEKYHQQKIKDRLNVVIQEEPKLQQLINSKIININGQNYLGVDPLLSLINEINQKTGILNPPFLTVTHGDLNITNIMVNPARPFNQIKELACPNKFVDPRGWMDIESKQFVGQDYMYDFAKLMQHFYTDFDFIKEELLYVFEENNNATQEKKYTIPHPFDIDDEFNFLAVNNYHGLKRKFEDFMRQQDDFFGLETGTQWKARLAFTLASITLSVTPFFLEDRNSELKAKTSFILGVYALNRAWFNILLELCQKQRRLANKYLNKYKKYLESFEI